MSVPSIADTLPRQIGGNVKNYDLCIKSDNFGVAETAQIIGDLFQKKMGL